jgi:4'-phosphopantetheinyl transferase
MAEAVDVWRADLAAAGPGYRELLSDDERERVRRFVRTEHGGHWSSARGILRALLGRYLDADPRSLQFELGPHGKPALAGLQTTLRFNISHARSIALYAISDAREVGVDVEHEDRRVNAVALARRIFGAEEADRLQTLDPVSRRREFLRAWVRHEAVVKCLGTGIGAYRNQPAGNKPPWVTELSVGPGAVGAVAVSEVGGGGFTLRCWEWPAGPAS